MWYHEAFAQILSQDLSQVEQAGFEKSWWDSVGMGSVWDYLHTYAQQYHQWPPWQHLVDQFNFPEDPPVAHEPLLAYRDRLWQQSILFQFHQSFPPDWDLAENFAELGNRLQQVLQAWQLDPAQLETQNVIQTASQWALDLIGGDDHPLWQMEDPVLLDVMRGWLPSEYMVLGGRPHSGKTWILLSLALHFWMANQVPVLFCNLELDPEEFLARWHALTGKLNYSTLMDKSQVPDMDQWMSQLLVHTGTLAQQYAHTPFHVLHGSDSTHSLTPGRLRGLVQRLGVRAVFIDQLSWLEADGRTQTIRERYVEVSRALRRLARDLRCAVFLNVQINREGADVNGPPPPQTIQESDNLFQDSTLLMTIAQNPMDAHQIKAKLWKSHVLNVRATEVNLAATVAVDEPPYAVFWSYDVNQQAPG